MIEVAKIALLLASTAGAMLAQDPPAVEAVPPPAAVQAPGFRCLVSQLMATRIGNTKNEALGEILEIVLDGRAERVTYAVVSFRGLVGSDTKYFALPWRLLELDRRSAAEAPRATLGLDRATLLAAPGFDPLEWPDMADPDWARQVDDYYRSRGEPTRGGGSDEPKGSGPGGVRGADQQPGSSAFLHRRLVKRIGMPVVATDRKILGVVEDLVIDTRRATVIGALIGLGDRSASGERFVLLPSEALTLDRVRGRFVVAATNVELEAMAFAADALPALDDDRWAEAGQVFVRRAASAPAADAADPAPSREDAADAEPYDVAATERITATVLGIGTVRVGERQQERVRLRVRSADGRDRIVYAGPSEFPAQAALGLRIGRVVEVVGSPFQSGVHLVLVAGSIAVEGRTVQLRDAEGRPLWATR